MWKQIKNSVYEISDNGEVRNSITKKIIKTQTTEKGYIRVGLRLEKNTPKKYRVNRLVAEVFNENYSDDLEVHHINNIRDDNRASNLICITSEENKLKRNKPITNIEIVKRTIEIYEKEPNLSPKEILSRIKN